MPFNSRSKIQSGYRPSDATMRSNQGVSAILNRWRNDNRYRRPDGTPRVLSIGGKGATLETLARRFVPQMAVTDVVAMICENAEVTRLKGNKIALVGSPVMMTAKNTRGNLGLSHLTDPPPNRDHHP